MNSSKYAKSPVPNQNRWDTCSPMQQSYNRSNNSPIHMGSSIQQSEIGQFGNLPQTQVEIQLGSLTPSDFSYMNSEHQSVWMNSYATSNSSASTNSSPNCRRSPDMSNILNSQMSLPFSGNDPHIDEQLANAARILQIDPRNDNDELDNRADQREPFVPSNIMEFVKMLGLPRSESGSDSSCSCTSTTGCDSCRNLLELQYSNRTSMLDQELSQRSPSPPTNMTMLLGSQFGCELHYDAQRVFCQTCSKSFCIECNGMSHSAHVTTYLHDAVETASMHGKRISNEATRDLLATQNSIEYLESKRRQLDTRAAEMRVEVMAITKRIIRAIEERGHELIQGIDEGHKRMSEQIAEKVKIMKTDRKKLEKANRDLESSMHINNILGDPQDIITKKDMVTAEMYSVRQNRMTLSSVEDCWLTFDSSQEQLILHQIQKFGSISTNNPGLIGDGRVRTFNVSPKRQQMIHVPINLSSPGSKVHNPFHVSLYKSRLSQVGMNYPIKVIGNNTKETDVTLCRPWGVACDADGYLVVADRSNNRIAIFRQDGSFVRSFGSHGSGPGQFDRPAGVAVDLRRRIVVADKDNHRIQILTMDGNFVLQFGSKGQEDGQFNYPWDVATNGECQIVVSDTRNHRVQLFSPEGIFLRKFGYDKPHMSHMLKRFECPRGVTFTREGNVLVTDFNNHRLCLIDSEFQNIRYIGAANDNSSNRLFLRPQGVCIDDDGNIIVADSRNHRIQVLDMSGNVKWRFGSFGQGHSEMDRPSGICLTPEGRIAVIDMGNNRLLLF